MRRYLTSLIPALLLMGPLTVGGLSAEDGVPPPSPPPGAQPPGSQPPGAKPEIMKEIREVEGQWRALREKADQDPEVAKLRQAADDAQKAYRTKADEVMAQDPTFAAVKAKREELRAKIGGPRGGGDKENGKDNGKEHKKDKPDGQRDPNKPTP